VPGGWFFRKTIMINLRKQIKAQMKRKKISVPVMARKLECHQGTLYDFLSGKKALGADYLQKLLNELGAEIQFK
jgi:plasmid maintenance system antidote protein VapI